MDQGDMRGWLDDHLNQLEWSDGLSKTDLILAVEDDEALRNMIGQYVAEGYYRTPAEVLNVIPEQAWQDVQGDSWHGGDTYDIAGTRSGFLESPVVRDHPEPAASHQTTEVDAGSASAGHREQLDLAVEKATASVQDVASQAPAIARQTADRARSLAADPRAAVSSVPPPVVALLLSALNEGFGQAYNRQYAKAGGFFLTGLTLSSASGINTWLLRDVLGLNVRFGPRRVRPVFATLWAATYLYNLWDAWLNAPATDDGG